MYHRWKFYVLLVAKIDKSMSHIVAARETPVKLLVCAEAGAPTIFCSPPLAGFRSNLARFSSGGYNPYPEFSSYFPTKWWLLLPNKSLRCVACPNRHKRDTKSPPKLRSPLIGSLFELGGSTRKTSGKTNVCCSCWSPCARA